MNKRALVVGIDSYAPPNSLPSCVADATAFTDLLGKQFSYAAADIKLLVNDGATKAGVLDGLQWLFTKAAPDDELVFFYSGHGYQPEINGEIRESLVTQDGEFLDDTELAAAMTDVPDGVLSIVLDTCFSGGLEKRFLLDSGLVKIILPKYWKPTAAKAGTRTTQTTQAKSFRPFARVTPTANKGFVLPGTDATITSLTLPASKGLLMSAAQEDETASASTPATDGQSAFTYSLLQAIASCGAGSSSELLVRTAGAHLHKLGLRQTPALKEPIRPAGMGSASFITLRSLQPSTAGIDAGNAVLQPQESNMQLNTSQLVSPYPFTFPLQGEQADKGWLDGLTGIVGAIVPHIVPIVAQVLQSKGFVPQNTAPGGAPASAGTEDKGWLESITGIVNTVVPVIVPIVAGALQSKGYTQVGKGQSTASPASTVSADKGWLDGVTNIVGAIVPHIVPIVAHALQSKGYAPQASVAAPAAAPVPNAADKDWIGSIASIVNTVVPVVVPIVAGALKSKGYTPGSPSAPAAIVPPLGFDEKGWQDVLSQVAKVAVPVALALV